MKKEDLITGCFYKATEGDSKHYWIFKEGKSGFILIGYHPQFQYLDAIFQHSCSNYQYFTATAEECTHLQACIKIRRYVEQPILNYEIY